MNINSAQLPIAGSSNPEIDNALSVREAFTSFVGEIFFSQMIKSMRSTTDKPAYFHGGRGEEIFTAQLDQTMAEEMTSASADKFANPMFERQFPQLGKLLREYETKQQDKPLFDAQG